MPIGRLPIESSIVYTWRSPQHRVRSSAYWSQYSASFSIFVCSNSNTSSCCRRDTTTKQWCHKHITLGCILIILHAPAISQRIVYEFHFVVWSVVFIHSAWLYVTHPRRIHWRQWANKNTYEPTTNETKPAHEWLYACICVQLACIFSVPLVIDLLMSTYKTVPKQAPEPQMTMVNVSRS